ncbi:putative prolyl isomerase Ess1 [Tilletiaria anomala UBC 951]|uniref:Peptidyl-prolyl cis-trans isomerase n=1 Tax=Tilletiaria anomala (strain ATCC 24038 / CBS 436.72 / UBC 951) TaxID=1037660 RepID=A0A066VEH1_TILAU|nr:putative prolyl isomerase Ess1 [Tilletiaria anomala UBC 951]KDN36975.1 putative prolyl isomerase Ess1 [Tilletiaria anomala UBC 951]
MSAQWEVRFSNTRKLPYFYDSASGTSTWEAPSGLSPEQISALPGAAQYLGRDGASSNSAAAGRDSATKVRASHLLIKHAKSRRPSSHRQANITRSPEEAEQIIRDHLKTLGPNPSAEAFAKLAADHSDCSSARSGGDLGFFSRGQMQKPFEDAAFSLPVGALSDIVQTESGTHVILRTA